MTVIKKGNKYMKKSWISLNKGISIGITFGIFALIFETWALVTIFGLF